MEYNTTECTLTLTLGTKSAVQCYVCDDVSCSNINYILSCGFPFKKHNAEECYEKGQEKLFKRAKQASQ